MLGNDVVDLADPETAPGAQHVRFDERVFGPAERVGIRTAAAPELARWTLWAAKEAAYKALHRRDPALRFAPRRLRATWVGADAVRVVYRAARLAVRVHASGSAIHALATEEGDAAPVVYALQALSGAEEASPRALSQGARRLAARLLAARLSVPESALVFAKCDGAPVLWLHGAPAPLLLSLSHHGRWVAFAARFAEGARGGLS